LELDSLNISAKQRKSSAKKKPRNDAPFLIQRIQSAGALAFRDSHDPSTGIPFQDWMANDSDFVKGIQRYFKLTPEEIAMVCLNGPIESVEKTSDIETTQ
jgi:hypothetical protein